jgi:predicted DNA binding CopG/RHH family protein
MSGTKKKIKKTKSSTKSASNKLLQSSVIQKPLSQKTGIKSTKADKPSSDIHTKTDKSLSSSLKKKKTKTLGSSQRENSKKQIKNPWDGYDYEDIPSISIDQARTFRKVTREENIKLSRGRPRKSANEKCLSITLRIEPSLLVKIKESAEKTGFPWQSYLKIMIERGMNA